MAEKRTSKRQQYIAQYNHAATAIEKYKEIQETIDDEQEAARYVESLLTSERQTLAALENEFNSNPPQDLSSATALLQVQYDRDLSDRERQARDIARYRSETGLTAADRVALNPAASGNTPAQARQAAVNLIKNKATTAEKAEAVLRYMERNLAGEPTELGFVTDAYNEAQGAVRRRAPSGPTALTPEQQQQREAQDILFKSVFYTGRAGIVGGPEGKAVADLRKTTVAPKETSFATAEDAFNAAIGAMTDGGLSREDFESDADFNYAREVYAEAKATQAYRNDEAKHFDPTVLAQRKRVSALEARLDAMPGSQYNDPSVEAKKRELQRRGYTIYEGDQGWKNQYLQYQNTPYFDMYVNAHEAVDKWMSEKGKVDLKPTTKAQQAAVQYAAMLDKEGTQYHPGTIVEALTDAGIGEQEARDAVTFLMAYKEIGGPKQGTSTYDQLEAAAKRAANMKEAAKLAAERQKRELEAQRKREFQMTEATATRDIDREYARLRAMGLSQEDARARLSMPEWVQEMAREEDLAAQSVAPAPRTRPTPKPAAPPAPAAPPTPPAPEFVEFIDESDPTKPKYRKVDAGFARVNADGSLGKTIPATGRAGIALSAAMKGRYDLVKKLQPKSGGGGGTGGGGEGGGDGGGGVEYEEYEYFDPAKGEIVKGRRPKQ